MHELVHLLLALGCLSDSIIIATSAAPVIVLTTWTFKDATDAAWDVLNPNNSGKAGTAIDAVVAGCTTAEEDPFITSVGYGNSPDENGHTALDAMVMDGKTMKVGAVASLTDIHHAAQVAREILFTTKLTLLVGPAATEFAKSRGFNTSSLDTDRSREIWLRWKANNCQPNFRIKSGWSPDPTKSCGPYKSNNLNLHDDRNLLKNYPVADEHNHDTIGIIALDANGLMAVGTSTSGLTFKIPGRVGDTPIPGAGGFVVNEIGGAAGTGDGDIMMRFLLSFQVVELMRQGIGPTEACKRALLSVRSSDPWNGALIALTRTGEYGAACVGFTTFNYCVRASWLGKETKVLTIRCMNSTLI